MQKKMKPPCACAVPEAPLQPPIHASRFDSASASPSRSSLLRHQVVLIYLIFVSDGTTKSSKFSGKTFLKPTKIPTMIYETWSPPKKTVSY